MSPKKLSSPARLLRLSLLILLAGGFRVAAAPPDPGWVQIWGDEFDGTAANPNQYGLDLDKWTPRLPWLNTSDNTYWHADSNSSWLADENAFVTNGTLVLRSTTCPPTTIPGHSTFNYSAAWVHSKNTLQYCFGYAETRLQSAVGSAMWPAWWFLGSGWPPEVDVFERYPYGRVHQGIYYNAAGTATWDSAFFDADPVYTMHQWGFEWKPGHMGLSKDGVVRNDLYSTNVPAQPLYMVLSAGVTTNAQGGNFSSQSFPDDFIIDYVRIYKRAEHVYNGDFAARLADWETENTNTTIAVAAGVGGGNALALANGADLLTPSRAAQLVYGLIPNTRYWVGASLNSAGNPVYLGISGHGGDPIEQATNSASYAAVDFVFTNGSFSTTASVYARLDAGAGLSANADNLQLRRAAAVADPGFELNDPTIYWGDSYGTVTIDSSNERSGNRCVALGAAASAAQQTIHGLRPNTTYQLSAWIRNNGNSQPCSLGVKNFGGRAGQRLHSEHRQRQLSALFGDVHHRGNEHHCPDFCLCRRLQRRPHPGR